MRAGVVHECAPERMTAEDEAAEMVYLAERRQRRIADIQEASGDHEDSPTMTVGTAAGCREAEGEGGVQADRGARGPDRHAPGAASGSSVTPPTRRCRSSKATRFDHLCSQALHRRPGLTGARGGKERIEAAAE